MRLTKENRELVQNQLEPLNQKNQTLNKEKDQLTQDLASLEKQLSQLQKSSEHELAQLAASSTDDQKAQQKSQQNHKTLNADFIALEKKLAIAEDNNKAANSEIKTLTQTHKADFDKLIATHKERSTSYEKSTGSHSDLVKSL